MVVSGYFKRTVKYDDLADPRVNLPPDKMSSLKAIFGTLYMADLETVELFTASENTATIQPLKLSFRQ